MPDGRNTQSEFNGNGESAASPAYPEWFLQRGLRFAELLISIDKGASREVAKQIIHKNSNVVFVTGRVNVVANVMAEVYFSDSRMLRNIIEDIKSLPNVSRVEFTEMVEVFGRRDDKQVEEDATKLVKSSGREW